MSRDFPFTRQLLVIAALGLLLIILIAADVEGVPRALPMVRLLLGLVFVLVIPGYALQAAVFPQADELDGPERLALSFGLSIAIIAPLALILDRLPWGIRLWPIVIGEALVISGCGFVAWFRMRRLPREDRPAVVVEWDLKGWWAGQDRTARILYSVIAGALVLATVSALAIIFLPKPGERFTEFYVLGPEGLAESYPREAAAGQPVRVTLGIANREGGAAEYRVEIRVDDYQIGGVGPVVLKDDEVWELEVAYSLPHAGEDQRVIFELFRDGGIEPYRTLRLWIDVVEGARS